ncbi:dephospho-CoA kinase [Corynebacterium lubricantis]|uniref:dephospho-CoA kinase n=1 Tax=Corynebacterium lubricantis TaxID=541095 RepID=UPI00036534FF|nr:dephospho-CoA kinase [Corynebacterium lubricantis]
MKKIGLTGGIGSGKTTVSKLLEKEGFPVINADEISRQVMEPGSEVLNDVAEIFGSDLIDKDGNLDRAELARRAFKDDHSTEALNGITHPAIRWRTERLFEQYRDEEAVIYDMPLLVENNMVRDMDMVVVVEVPADIRIERLVSSRGLDADDVRRRMAQQATDEERAAVADVIIDNSGTETDLAPQVKKLVEKIHSLS